MNTFLDTCLSGLCMTERQQVLHLYYTTLYNRSCSSLWQNGLVLYCHIFLFFCNQFKKINVYKKNSFYFTCVLEYTVQQTWSNCWWFFYWNITTVWQLGNYINNLKSQYNVDIVMENKKEIHLTRLDYIFLLIPIICSH